MHTHTHTYIQTAIKHCEDWVFLQVSLGIDLWILHIISILLFCNNLIHLKFLNFISSKNAANFSRQAILNLTEIQTATKIPFCSPRFILYILNYNARLFQALVLKEYNLSNADREWKKFGKRGGCNKDREKCILESRIIFPDQKWMTLDTPHGPYKKFLKNVRQMRKNEVGNCWFLIPKLDLTK